MTDNPWGISDPTPERLAGIRRWMTWLYKGDLRCICWHDWKQGGRLYGVPDMAGWVRMDTNPQCPIHGDDSPDPRYNKKTRNLRR